MNFEANTRAGSIHQQFEVMSRLHKDRIALVHNDAFVTYSGLNERANRLARYLISLGVGDGVYVTLFLDRSVELIVAILATLKAGATYIPLDAHYPNERIKYVLEDSKSLVMLTTSDHGQQEGSPYLGKQVVLDDFQTKKIIDAQDSNNLGVDVSPKNIAYVIYTSGSTGEPKGVEIPHENVVKLIDSGNEIYSFGKDDVWTLFHSPAFDFSVWEMYGPLLNGGKLVIVPYCVSRNPATYYDLLHREKVTVLNQTPTAFHQLSSHMQGVALKKELNLRYIIFGGEKLPTEILRPWREHYVGTPHKLFNMYGITETCVHVTYAELSGDALSSRPSGWIGWPIPGSTMLVVNDKGEVAASGDSGEIYVGGFGLASGYLGRPELTQKVFVLNTFSQDHGPRLYKTGDRARVLPDGSFEYLDRKDRQVKLRGFRIELGEIESELMKHPSVRQATVLLQEKGTAAKDIAAFVSLNSEEEQGRSLLQKAKVKDWEKIYDQFAKDPETHDPCLDFEGWNSSFTGKPILREEMIEWAEETVGRIKKLNPKNILEIGCGHGMFLFRLADAFESYSGVDVSSESLDRIRERVDAYTGNIGSVSLHQGDALSFLSKEKPECDTIIINSVIQYFPGIDYLTSVLKSAVSLLENGGSILIGDVRDWRLLETFQSAIHLYRSDDTCSAGDLLERIRHSVKMEEELLVAPEYFVSLAREMSKIDNVEILLKESEYDNELNDFRYDVVLHVNKAAAPTANVSWTEWGNCPEFIDAVSHQLKEGINYVGIRNAPNKRLLRHFYAHDLIGLESSLTKTKIVKAVENKVNTSQELLQASVLEKLAKSFSYSIERRCGVGQDRCDILLKKNGSKNEPISIDETSLSHCYKVDYSNDPLKYELRKSTVLDLRQYLKERLPAHMVPGSITVIDEMPITGNGKVDESALIRMVPASIVSSIDSGKGFDMTSSEKKVSEIWKSLLGVGEISLNDNFFDIGGHSLLLMDIISEIEDAFKVDLSVEDVFSSPTLSSISQLIDNRINIK